MSTNSVQAQQTGSNGKYASVNGINMYYEIHGSGQPLVLIHGGGSTIYTTFGKILPELAKHHQVISVELQAHGHTSDRNAPSSFEQDADDVASLLKQLNIAKASFFGFSNGGNTAMQVAIRHPEIVNKLIIASSLYRRDGMPQSFWDGMNHATIDNMPKQLRDAYLKINNDSAGLMTMFKRDAVRMQNFKDWNEADIKSIKAPTLVIAASNDVMTPEHTVALYRLFANGQLAILPGGHGDYLGEITTSAAPGEITYVLSLFDQFLHSK
ncbi:alpha/beta fold hydrolase [Pinibacter soli]|uniref:Alpha/beta hydrolase n=1 Tax=Pinibacter soli TaxID=3044211 RepID=A0ABT6RGL6_9BACT|nr:alpha/beta hydrolase [Pinibacter soli]MDI3321510.1 alpha/beta hydrolase [Pinibacter soli]